MTTLGCNNPDCPGFNRPVFPMGRRMADHIRLFHGGDEIPDLPEVRDIDPDGTVGEAIIDRTLKLMDEYERHKGTRPPYKSKKSQRIFCSMLGEADKDIHDLVNEALQR